MRTLLNETLTAHGMILFAQMRGNAEQLYQGYLKLSMGYEGNHKNTQIVGQNVNIRVTLFLNVKLHSLFHNLNAPVIIADVMLKFHFSNKSLADSRAIIFQGRQRRSIHRLTKSTTLRRPLDVIKNLSLRIFFPSMELLPKIILSSLSKH